MVTQASKQNCLRYFKDHEQIIEVSQSMSKQKLPKEEQELLDSLEAGEYESVLTDSRKRELQLSASHTFKKDKRINIRISNRDLVAIQSKASEEGIPYQTLVSSIIHKYISGSLQDLTANKSSKRTQ